MNAIKPIFPSDPKCARPDKKAVLQSQSIDWDAGMEVTCTQTWVNPDGTEFNLELRLEDGKTEEGEVISCAVNDPNSLGFGTGVVACSGIMPANFPMPRTLQASGVVGTSSPKDEVTLEEVEGDPKDDNVEGMDYDFTDTGLMNKKRKLE